MAISLLSPNAKQQFLDNAGNPAAGYKLYTYAANTLTPQATYSNRAGTAANTNPIVLDARGEAIIYLTPGVLHDYVLKTPAEVTVWTREDISADAGDADAVSFIQTGGNAVPRTVQSKNRDIVSTKDFGAAVDGATNDTAALAATIATGRDFILPSGDSIVTAINNPLGVEYSGDGRLLKPITGGHQQLNTKADDGQHVTGREYLWYFINKIRTTRAAKVVCSGDSTTEGGGLSSPYLFNQYVGFGGFNRGVKIDAINAGHSSQHTGTWVASYLAGDLAQNPDLYIVRWGINDPFYGRSINDFATSLRAGLAQCRAAKTVQQMSILLCVPNSTGDTPNNRDERWYEQVRKVVRQAARDYQCCMIDLYSMFKDPRGGANAWLDDPFGDGRGIHPKETLALQIGSAVCEVIYPPDLLPRVMTSTYYTPAVGDPPSTYPYGWSVYNGPVNTVSWPIYNAVITTHKSIDGNCIQTVTSTNSATVGSAAANGGLNLPQIAVRIGTSNISGSVDTWGNWITQPSISLTSALSNSWVDFAADCAPRATISNNVVTLSGMVKNGTLTDGTVILTLPSGFRPRQNPEYFIQQTGVAGTVATCAIRILSNGQLAVMDGALSGFISLSGISFEAGN